MDNARIRELIEETQDRLGNAKKQLDDYTKKYRPKNKMSLIVEKDYNYYKRILEVLRKEK